MQLGEYIIDRWMVRILQGICEERGFGFKTFSSGWVIEMTRGDNKHRVIGYQFDLNDAVASGVAKDKVAAHLLLEDSAVPSVPHMLLRPKVSEAQKQALRKWQDIVVKPLDGSGGHFVRRFSDAQEAVDWIESTDITAWAAAPFLDIQREIRLVLLDQTPLIIYEKEPVTKDGLKMFNLGLGATPRDLVPDEPLLALAIRAQSALGLRLSAVDVVETMSGERFVLEVNSGFMMEHYMRFSEDNKQRTVQAYKTIVDRVMSR